MKEMTKEEKKILRAIYEQIELYTQYIDFMKKKVGRKLYYIEEEGKLWWWVDKKKTIKMGFDRENSPICKAYNENCNGCIIKTKTEKPGCENTPFKKIWECMYSKNENSFYVITKELIGYLEEELEFLRSLVGIDDIMGCYDPKTHNCDGRCQGCSDCPMAEYIKGYRRSCSRKTMLKEIEESKRDKVYWNKIFLSDKFEQMAKDWGKKVEEIQKKYNRYC